jgi:hypothetical protein
VDDYIGTIAAANAPAFIHRRAGIMDCKTRLERYLRENGVP